MSIAQSVKVPVCSNGKGFYGSEIDVEVPDALQVLKNGQTPAGKRCFTILNKSGDDRIVWDGGVLAEIGEAKRMFDKLVMQGLVPHRVDSHGRSTPEVMDEFDARAEEVVFLPTAKMLVGG
jgi:hypothetical protein